MAGESASPAAFQILEGIGIANLPEDWDVVRVETLLSDERGIAVGVMYPGDHDPAGVPLIRAGDLVGSRINARPEFRITADKHYEYRRTKLEGGELLISLVGDVGRCAVVPPVMAGWNVARAIAVLRFSSSADAAFVRACLMSAPLQHLMQTWSTTTVQATLNLKEIRQIPLPWPPKKQRDAIAHILGTLDDKIELNRRMNETLEAMARALFKSWFVDFDPVRARAEGRDTGLPREIADLFPDSFEESELGEIPKGWRLGQFGEIVDQLREQDNPQVFPGSLFSHYSLPAFDDGQQPEREYGECIKSTKWRVQAGVILLSKLNPEIERVWMVDVDLDDRAVCSTEFLVLVARTPFTRTYVYCLARSRAFREQIQTLVTGTSNSHQRAQADAILALSVIIPPAEVVNAFDDTVSKLLERTLACRRESQHLAALRDTLLPKLISGELRVQDAERIVAGAESMDEVEDGRA